MKLLSYFNPGHQPGPALRYKHPVVTGLQREGRPHHGLQLAHEGERRGRRRSILLSDQR